MSIRMTGIVSVSLIKMITIFRKTPQRRMSKAAKIWIDYDSV